MFQAIYVGGISTTNLLVPIYSLFPFAPVLLRPNGALHSKDSLPVYSSDEFKPFIPKLPECTFWCIWMVTFTVALMSSFSWHAQFFAFVLCGGIPVLGPPIRSMMKHKHLQFNFCNLVYKKKKTKKHE
ncbi:protein RER1A-like [Cornus florida]|uniref:protein RER1A-like n=1 Tax=Cornus florida TaxID=4283 RepID=UPI002899FD69|nr:protein RER1A-like [Cornus florida]